MTKSIMKLNAWNSAFLLLTVFLLILYFSNTKTENTACNCSPNETKNLQLSPESTLIDAVNRIKSDSSNSDPAKSDSPDSPNSADSAKVDSAESKKPESNPVDSASPESDPVGSDSANSEINKKTEKTEKRSSDFVPAPAKSAIPTETGAWNLGKGYTYFLDEGLAEALGEIFYKQTVLELGAGKGRYTNALKGKVKHIDGYDGAPNVEEETNGFIRRADLTERQEFGLHDWVLCLEVGEHVPSKFELMVIDNIHRHNTKGVVLSWAVPGQGGNGHVNIHSNEYIRNLMKALGYGYNITVDSQLRNLATLKWFKMTLMVFRKEENKIL